MEIRRRPSPPTLSQLDLDSPSGSERETDLLLPEALRLRHHQIPQPQAPTHRIDRGYPPCRRDPVRFSPPPPPKHRGREATAGMRSSGGAMAPPEHRLKVGSGFSGGAMAPPERRGKKGTGSIEETPLTNLSNLIGSPRFRIKEPLATATATQPQRVARETKYTRPWSSSSPRDPSLRTAKAGAGLIIETPRGHQLATSSPQKYQGSPQKHQAVAGSPHKHQAATGSPLKHQAAMSLPRQKHQAAVSSPHKHLNVPGSNGEKPRKHRSVRRSNAETPLKHPGVLVSSEPTLQMYRVKGKVGGGSSGEMAQKSYSKERTRPSHHLSSTRRTGTVTELEATSAKRLNKNTSYTKKSSLRTNQNLRTRRSTSEFDASNGRSLDADHGNNTAEDNKGSTAKEDGCLTEEMIRNKQEVDDTIRQLNELGHGEDISYEEFEGYLERLPCVHAHVDTSLRPNYEQLNEFQLRNILYHIKYCKFTRQKRMDGMLHKLEDDHPLYHLEEKLECLEEEISKLEGDDLLYYLEKEGLLRQIENDELFDWSFHYRTIVALDDYQRLIPQNYGRYEYARWDTYRDYFHIYEIELEYLVYWKELLKELKWMEDYVLLKPSLKWGKICTRGCYQAVKIASRFSKITERLARGAYYDCIDTMRLDIIWYKELDGVYFEIWQRTTMLKENFKEALNAVFKSEKFPLRHQEMKDALENDCSEMEEEFRACTAGITAGVKEDSGRELVADAIKNQRGRPKFYAQYIRKKIEVAKAIGVIPAVVT